MSSRLAAGRKKLEEYKLKKKPNTSNGTPAVDAKPDIESNGGGPLIQSNNQINPESINHNDASQNFALPINNSNNAAANFFDKIVENEPLIYGEVQNKSSDSLPLAGQLFTNQYENSIHSDDFLQQNTQHTELKPRHDAPGDSPTNEDSADEAVSSSAYLRLQQQLQFHTQTVEFLVSEKNDLSTKVNNLESVILQLKNQNEDLSGRLNISRHRASCLEVEYSNIKEKHNELNEQLQQALEHNKNYSTAETTHVKECEDLNEELQDTKSLIRIKIQENNDLRKKIEDLTFHLNASDLRLQQLNQGAVHISNDQYLIQQNQELKQQIDSLNHQLKVIDLEKNQSNAQYQQYVQQLNNQLESMSHKHEEIVLENENLINRESNLIQQMQALEKQLQSTIHTTPERQIKEAPDADASVRIKELENENSKMNDELNQRNVSLQMASAQLKSYEIQIEELSNTIQTMNFERPDITKLNAANESDRIAAQMATSQNTKLKNDLDSLQEAYKKMTDDKLELAELLQAEKNLTRTLTLTMADNEEKLKQIQTKLIAKDEEMIRLQAESSELEKESLKHAQILDRLHHYEAQNQSSDIIQKELELAKSRLRLMSDEKDKLSSLLLQNNIPIDSSVNPSESNDKDNINENGDDKKEDQVVTESLLVENQIGQYQSFSRSEHCMHLNAPDAMRKLQDRFTKLMDDIADLSDDKQRLEHLVIQLQGETDTIGEYIALYQKQRSVLKQREYEKDIQLNLVSQERQHMKDQLDQLNRLVEELVKENENPKGYKVMPVGVNIDKGKTSDQIIELLNEIKSSNLIEPTDSNGRIDNFHPCPWCSGKLMTV